MEKIFSLVYNLFLNYKTYLVISIIFLLIGRGKKYINITGIIKEYYKNFILKNRSAIFVLICFPFFLAISISFKKTIDSDLLELITVAISILMSLFFTYLSFFQDYEEKELKNIENYNLIIQQKNYVTETKIVASYEIFLSITVLICCFSYPLFSNVIQKVYSGIIYFLFFHLLTNLLVLLKRYNNNL